ncbi:MAG TPA: 4Fe-4S binding protein [Negativicutes bacterium]|nr:4Fe-4S binding protein [Negativicutes bacterium]
MSQRALKLSGCLNKEGYDYVTVDNGKCIKCGICYTVCPDSVCGKYGLQI